MAVVDFDAARIRPYITTALEGFLKDPPDTRYQLGYLAALCALYREGLGQADDARLIACEQMLARLAPMEG